MSRKLFLAHPVLYVIVLHVVLKCWGLPVYLFIWSFFSWLVPLVPSSAVRHSAFRSPLTHRTLWKWFKHHGLTPLMEQSSEHRSNCTCTHYLIGCLADAGLTRVHLLLCYVPFPCPNLAWPFPPMRIFNAFLPFHSWRWSLTSLHLKIYRTVSQARNLFIHRLHINA